jgi:hypothetical protein
MRVGINGMGRIGRLASWGSAVMLGLCLVLVFALPGGVEQRPVALPAAS